MKYTVTTPDGKKIHLDGLSIFDIPKTFTVDFDGRHYIFTWEDIQVESTDNYAPWIFLIIGVIFGLLTWDITTVFTLAGIGYFFGLLLSYYDQGNARIEQERIKKLILKCEK